jgi:hypothetical protein
MNNSIKTLLVAFAICALALANTAFSQVITVLNHGFTEAATVPNTVTGANPFDWVVVEYDPNGVGLMSQNHSVAAGDAIPALVGTQFLRFTNRNGNLSDFTRITQEIFDGTTLQTQAGLDYTITVGMFDFGLINGDGTANGGGPVRFGLYTDAAMTGVLAETTIMASELSGTQWTDFSVTYSSSVVGQSLFIGFENLDSTGSNRSIGIDNVRLEAIPEPATTALLLGLGALALILTRRRGT